MRTQLIRLGQPLLQSVTSPFTIRGSYCSALGIAGFCAPFRYQTTAAISHAKAAPSYHHAVFTPVEPVEPLGTGELLSQAALAKGAHLLKREILDAKLSANPPYMLGRDYQASARLVGPRVMMCLTNLDCSVKACPASSYESRLNRLLAPPFDPTRG